MSTATKKQAPAKWAIGLAQTVLTEMIDGLPATPYLARLIERESPVGKLTDTLKNMIAVAYHDGWKETITGRELVLYEAERVLRELGVEI